MIVIVLMIGTFAGPWAFEALCDVSTRKSLEPEWRFQKTMLRQLRQTKTRSQVLAGELKKRTSDLGIGQPLPTILKEVRGLLEKRNVQVVAVAVLPKADDGQELPNSPGFHLHSVRLSVEGTPGDLLSSAQALAEAPSPLLVNRMVISEGAGETTTSSRMDLVLGVLVDKAEL